MRIVGELQPVELPVKRLYLPGLTIEDDCPDCGRWIRRDLGSDYLSYPTPGVPEVIGFGCEEGHELNEWTCTVVLRLSLEAVEE